MHSGGILTNKFIRIITTSVETAAHYGTVTQIKSLGGVTNDVHHHQQQQQNIT